MNTERLTEISERLKTQDNRITAEPMFCLQIKVRDIGYDSNYCEDCRCWVDTEDPETVIYDKDPTDSGSEETKGAEWEEFGYKDRWETVMVAFTEAGLEEYMKLNGHNVKSRAYNGEYRIYVDSFHRCREMIDVRKMLMDAKLVWASAEIEKALRAVPVYHEGTFFIPHCDGDGNPIGDEPVDPVGLVCHLITVLEDLQKGLLGDTPPKTNQP